MSSSRSRASDWTWRRRLSACTVFLTILLLSWGGAVTSIGAGMAFPDWPTSLGSYNLINPVDEWWQVPAYLAEHGHRLLASLVGGFTVALAAWTWWEDPRAWMRRLGLGAVALVLLQGILGGLRVLWVSLNLAMVHACVAQLFFATLVAMTLFVTDTWRRRDGILPRIDSADHLRRWSYAAAVVIYLQIVLGALLRHPGAGMSGGYTALHVTGAFAVVGIVIGVFVVAEKHFDSVPAVRRTAWVLFGTMGVQFALGLASLLLTLYETAGQGSVVAYVILTVAHVVVGAVLLGASVVMSLLVSRSPQRPPQTEPTDGTTRNVPERSLARANS
ncbi:COX15/CtaA family protein [Salinibacter altiplanensis]|uniref:COX15/CtaA family protein n=1 Tax=Salinibacter altiplanensis TaxID=1803181 RepID=UPI000C9F1A78|nr:COX15/CtaA family protein [Salinibacter altiplanensis]